MDIPPDVWNQLKNVTVERFTKALEKDGWEKDPKRSATIPYIKKDDSGKVVNRVVIHFYPKKTFGKKLLTGLITQIGWSIEDLIRFKTYQG